MDYARRENETDQELIYRICKDKQLIGSWNDVAGILNSLLGCNYTESKYRKEYQMFEKMFEANRSSLVDEDKYIKELKEQEEKIRKERIKLQTLNIERSRIDRAEARRELFYEQIGRACTTLPLPDFKPLENNDNDEMHYLVCLADLHYGAEFESINNSYSPLECKERMICLLGDLKKFIDKNEVKELSVVGLGDFIQGILRLSDLKINDTSVVQAVVEVSRLIGWFLNTLSTYVNINYYHTPTANHTQIRVLGANANELCDEDVEYIIGNYIKDLCKDNPRVKVHLAENQLGYIQIPIYNFNVYAMHGHRIKNVRDAIKDFSMLTHNIVDYLVLGHMHCGQDIVSYESVCNDLEVLVCPSFVGSDPYSDSLFKGGKAAVNIFGFDEIEGHTETYKIILN